MAILTETVKVLQCERCEYKWTPRGKRKPKVCPICKSRDWNKPRPVRQEAATV